MHRLRRSPPPPPAPPPPDPVDVPCSSSLLAMLLLHRRKSSASASSASSSSSLSSHSSSFGSAVDLRLPRKLRRPAPSSADELPSSAASADRIVPRSCSALSEPVWCNGDRCSSGDLMTLASAHGDSNPRAEALKSVSPLPLPPKQRSNSDAALHRFCDDRPERSRQSSRKRSPLSRTEESFSSAPSSGYAVRMKRQELTLSAMQRVAVKLKSGSEDERWEAAEETRLMTKEDAVARITLAMLGVIPPLVAMLDAEYGACRQQTAILALLNLAVGNEMNKSEIVKAQAVPKMVALLGSEAAELQDAAVMAFLSLSALEGNKAAIGASGAIAWLVRILSVGGAGRRCKDALRALYNLSISAANAAAIEQAGGVPLLLAMVEDVEMSEKSLATLSNLAATEAGRGAIVRHREIAFAVLVDALRWAEAPKCQERAAYVLMMIAHHAPQPQQQRDAMAAAGAIAALLELALLGSPLAQKRAARALDSFRRGKHLCAPPPASQKQDTISKTVAVEGDGEAASCRRSLSERRVVDSLVRQSLQRTMRRIVKRATVVKRSSDSLPY